MNIPLADLKAQYRKVRPAVEKAVRRVFERGDFILGEDVRKLEEEFAQFCGAKFAVGVDSGTGALELSLRALNIGPGDEVIVPVFTFYATAFAVSVTGAKPVFVDVENDTANIDVEKMRKAVTSKTRAVIPVHLFGQPADMNAILAVTKKRGIAVVEDAAQAHGAQMKLSDGRWHAAGSAGDMACFSFYPAKNLGACGDGGMVTTNDSALYQQLRLYRDCGRTGRYEHVVLGHNRRLDTLQAAILRVKLKHLNAWNSGRQKNAALYDKLFADTNIQTLKSAKMWCANMFTPSAFPVERTG